jgi:hypothetical protein
MQELDLFPAEGSTSTIVEMRYENKTLRVLPAKGRGAPSTPMLSETGKTIFRCGAASSIFRTTGTAYPVGTMNMFRTYDGPANDLRFVGEVDAEIYVSPKILDHCKGIELVSESNPLAVCRRPEATVQVLTSNQFSLRHCAELS